MLSRWENPTRAIPPRIPPQIDLILELESEEKKKDTLSIIFFQQITVVSTNRPRGGQDPLTTGVKQDLPYRTGREAWFLSVSTE